jgi:DNA-binding response OmpR family regulator
LTRHLGLLEKREGELVLFADAFAYWVEQLLHAPKDTAVPAPPVTDELLYDSQTRMVRVDGREVRLTSLEGRLLDYFLAHKNEVCTVENLLEDVWGPGKSRSVVEKAVNRLRTKVERDPKRPRFILSARGEGYLLRLP